MAKRNKILFTIILLFSILGWHLTDSLIVLEGSITPLEIALQSAGNSRNELEKVLLYYRENSSDSLKYRAVCFLIVNMPFYSYLSGKQLENYKSYYSWLKKSKGKSPEQVADSVKKVFGPIGNMVRKRDILEIDSAYLCHNIEWAFKVWKEQPWGKNISFDMFCEYILPYRIDDEPLAYWREMYYEKYNSLLDSLRMSNTLDKEDPVVAASYLIERLLDKEHIFTSVTPTSFGHIGPEYVQYLSGSCREVTDFCVYLFRALGIPCAIDFIPMSGSGSAGHFWLVTWDKNGEDYKMDFPEPLQLVRKSWWYAMDMSAKMYRYTFSVNRGVYESMAAYGEELYPFWRLPKFKDVTHGYAQYYKKEMKIPSERIYKEKRDGKIAYLCLSSRDRWIPVDWTEYDRNNLVFRNLKKSSIMRVATYENGSLHFVTDPFIVDGWTNKSHYYSAGEEKQDVVLYAKSNIDTENLFRDRMIGGVFEGSNRADFADKDTLFLIQSKPYRLRTVVKSWSDKKYRYLRYVGPENASCNVAEIAFYEPNDTTALKGNVLGTPGCSQQDGSHEYTNAFDGKTWTSFDYIEPTGGWTGLDAGKEVQVDRIVYTPRNRDNYIRPGDTFELFYCDGDWKSAGMMIATTDSLVYRNIPKDVLLLLRNHTRGVDERIFVYENGTQAWK
ncbi:transglutaminase domain-containing protein [Bacteroides thetaiotaomicron]|uniref:Transglutaminase domain-containing protein n=1 Tax=Bacteroides thetaiotaomicron TaxID=818 RepID=A0AAW4Z831_BACT4|nr:transglutaminase domain-containing protein [Bacteroides thetaiotaomicron]MBV4310613.1 transglutaminase domain-containing protein [Bacteroides thetaiotaomicron]MBV4329649.1 transglutaminase domain-containing protein [Bacteroides thetaiotaomicron]MCB7385017.1 transglutaminase domain-containing protein [Bacteroides thetaiotaomicron]MCE9237949.1 transglutaminase domain-containing protein [Bacteroides thetaiotaomicron]MCE9267619.1 transglutaminase domain-containing protein [Bacteroides thetaiota